MRALTRSSEVEKAVVAAINENYLQDVEATVEDYSGNLLLVKDIVIRYIRGGVLPYDAAHDDFTVEGLEERIGQEFAFESAGKSLRVVFGGLADRIDRLPDGTLRSWTIRPANRTSISRGSKRSFVERPNSVNPIFYRRCSIR